MEQGGKKVGKGWKKGGKGGEKGGEKGEGVGGEGGGGREWGGERGRLVRGRGSAAIRGELRKKRLQRSVKKQLEHVRFPRGGGAASPVPLHFSPTGEKIENRGPKKVIFLWESAFPALQNPGDLL